MNGQEFYEVVPRERVASIVRDVGTPGYTYFPEIVERQLSAVRTATRNRFEVHYAVKANPNPDVLSVLAGLGCGADVASGRELRLARAAGIAAEEIEFSGPGKRREEIDLAVAEAVGSINVESVEELSAVAERAREQGRRARVGIRLNPGALAGRAGMRMAGDTQFGVMQEQLPDALSAIAAQEDHLDFTGFHAHFASQELGADALVANMRILLDAVAGLGSEVARTVRKLNFGGGWGIPYFPGQQPLDVAALGSGVEDLLSDRTYDEVLRDARLIVEPGRFLVGESGIFSTTVLYVKKATTKWFAVVDGGLNANYVLAGGMGTVIRRNFELDVLEGVRDDRPQGPYDIAGPLCTPQDVLATGVWRERGIGPGDVVVFFNCGAYGPTASPLDFLSHPRPTESVVAAVRQPA